MPADIPESGRWVADHDPDACLYPAGCTGCIPPPGDGLIAIVAKLDEPTVRAQLEGLGFEVIVSEHVPQGTAYLMREPYGLLPPPRRQAVPGTWADYIDDIRGGDFVKAAIVAEGVLEHSDEKRVARFLPGP